MNPDTQSSVTETNNTVREFGLYAIGIQTVDTIRTKGIKLNKKMISRNWPINGLERSESQETKICSQIPSSEARGLIAKVWPQ